MEKKTKRIYKKGGERPGRVSGKEASKMAPRGPRNVRRQLMKEVIFYCKNVETWSNHQKKGTDFKTPPSHSTHCTQLPPGSVAVFLKTTGLNTWHSEKGPTMLLIKAQAGEWRKLRLDGDMDQILLNSSSNSIKLKFIFQLNQAQNINELHFHCSLLLLSSSPFHWLPNLLVLPQSFRIHLILSGLYRIQTWPSVYLSSCLISNS